MQIAIDVDEELIKYFTKHNCMNDDGWFSHSSKLLNAFRNGTPLPKGHGRLIDADNLMELAHNHIKGTVDCNDIARLPIVVEADLPWHEPMYYPQVDGITPTVVANGGDRE